MSCTQKCLPDLTASYPYRNFDLPNSAILLRWMPDQTEVYLSNRLLDRWPAKAAIIK